MQQRVDFLLKGIRAERERLETGVFRVTGQIVDRNEELGDFRDLIGMATVNVAFGIAHWGWVMAYDYFQQSTL